MRILVISNVPWDDRNSYGNTLSNWFSGWTNAEFFCVYCRSSKPDNNVCHKHYTVPPLALMKNFLRPSKTGWAIDSQKDTLVDHSNQEANLIKSAQHGNNEWMYLISDLAYSTGVWKTSAYKKFIQEANPDIVFSFGIADAFIYENYCYVKKHTQAKIVTFVADDVYGTYVDGKQFRNKLQARRFRKMIAMTDLLYGASETMCKAYKKEFGKEVKPLYKGCTFASVKNQVGKPLKIVYAGNLLWGRSDILAKIATELERINQDGLKASLEIYTGSFLTPEMKSSLNKGESSRIMGRKSYKEIVETLHNADIVLHVESFDPATIKVVRYSFSTKIIDCLQSGTAMMVVGPAGIASVEYPRTIPGAIVIDHIDSIGDTIETIVRNPEQLIERAVSISEFAQVHHSIQAVRESMINDFINLINVNNKDECTNHRKK